IKKVISKTNNKQMKKTMKFLIGLIAAIMITGVVSAQHGNAPAGHVTLGIKGGLNFYIFTMTTIPVLIREQGLILDCLVISTETASGQFSLNWYILPRVQKITIWVILIFLSCFNICLTTDSEYRP